MTAKQWMAPLAITLGLALASAPTMADNKKDLVAKVVRLQQSGVEGLANTLANNTAGQVLQAAGQMITQVPADKREAVAKEMQADAKKFYDEIAPLLRAAATKLAPEALGAVYEEKFSEDELKTLITWLESPVNKKFQETAGELQQSLAQRLVNESKAQIEPRLKAVQQQLNARISAATGNAGSKPAPKK